jgi:hypothetical protein
MKWAIVLTFMIGTTLWAQTNTTNRVMDSTGTATTAWQKVDLGSTAPKFIEIHNTATTGTTTIIFALNKTDTAAVYTKYQHAVDPGKYYKIDNCVTQYLFLKASTGTCTYNVNAF